MEFITVKENPEFSQEVRQWTRKTIANGAEMAEDIGKLLSNDVYLKRHLEELDGNAVKDGDKGVEGGVATLDDNGKLVQHVEYDHVDNVPAPAWANITGKPSAYLPSSHTHNKSEVGLGNVNNTADSDKRVAYAADADTVDGKHASAFATSSHTHSAATQSAAGLMSAADKKKLDGVAASANNYSHPTSAGNKHIPAGGSSGQILRWSADGTAAWGADNNTTYSAATQSAAGLMSAADKKKLDGVAASANNYSHPTSTGNKHIPAGGSSGQILRWSADGTATWGADNNTTYGNMGGASASAAGKAGLVPAPAAGAQGKFLRGDGSWQTPTNTTYSAATQSANGLMSAADKKKLDGIAASANNYSHPSSHAATMISQDSTHRFVTDTEKSTWNGKANGSHTHSYLPLSGGTVTGAIKNTNIYPLLTDLGNGIVWGADANGHPTITAYANSKGTHQFSLMPEGWDNTNQLKYQLLIGSDNSIIGIWCRTDNLYQLGASGNRFKTLYAATGTIQTSDKNFKDDIKEFDAYFVQTFIMGINPVSYKLKDGDSGRTHYGMIAQDVENLMESLGMNSKDFAGFIKSPKKEQFYNPETKEMEVKTVEGEYIYALRYEEFISPLIKMVQIQQKEIEELRERLDKLELLPNLKNSDSG